MSLDLTKATRWVVTAPFDKLPELTFPTWVKFACYQKEKGEETDYVHWQIYVIAKYGVTFKSLQKAFPHSHIEKAHASTDQCIAYCTKEETRVGEGSFSVGEAPRQGARTDLEGVIKAIKDGQSLSTITGSHPREFIKYTRGISALLSLRPPPRRDGLCIELYTGPPRTGKSQKAHDENPDAYTYLDSDNGWFDGYNGETTVIMDEFYGHTPLHLILKIFDRYPLRVPVKGGFVPLMATKFVITTNYKEDDLYPFHDAFHARIRDFGTITEFKITRGLTRSG